MQQLVVFLGQNVNVTLVYNIYPVDLLVCLILENLSDQIDVLRVQLVRLTVLTAARPTS